MLSTYPPFVRVQKFFDFFGIFPKEYLTGLCKSLVKQIRQILNGSNSTCTKNRLYMAILGSITTFSARSCKTVTLDMEVKTRTYNKKLNFFRIDSTSVICIEGNIIAAIMPGNPPPEPISIHLPERKDQKTLS